MTFYEEHILGGRKIVLRSPAEDETQLLLGYIKTVCGETDFLMCYPDEIKLTDEEELAFIRTHNTDDDKLLMLAFVDGEYAGNCSFQSNDKSRRNRHRAGIGIALFSQFTGQGLGRLMLERLIDIMRECGFEQAELSVFSGNERAYHLYESLGFRECGRIPRANKLDDGTYSDEIIMVLPLMSKGI